MRAGRIGRAVAAVAAGVTAIAAGLPAQPPGDAFGDPARGRILFEAKRCVECHSLWGHGGTLGPDIARAAGGLSVPELAGAFWNHTPRMIDQMRAEGYAWPELDRDEMGDLLSYLYYLRLFDAPGDAERGAAAFERLGCSACHDVGAQGAGGPGGALDELARFASAVPLVQAMWNAAPDMQEAQVGAGRPIPRFRDRDIADIQAFLRRRGSRGDAPVELLTLPDPARGRELFRAKGCARCHEGPRRVSVDLTEPALHRSVSEVAGELWNHSYAMRDRMRARGIAFPRFAGSEMADVISYVYFKGFLGSPGDARAGARVFRERGCARCHTGPDAVGPDLARALTDDPVALAAAMWNHAPAMHELMGQQGAAWPKFEPGEMEDLVAYLRSLESP